jgi:hypothetical protein
MLVRKSHLRGGKLVRKFRQKGGMVVRNDTQAAISKGFLDLIVPHLPT